MFSLLTNCLRCQRPAFSVPRLGLRSVGNDVSLSHRRVYTRCGECTRTPVDACSVEERQSKRRIRFSTLELKSGSPQNKVRTINLFKMRQKYKSFNVDVDPSINIILRFGSWFFCRLQEKIPILVGPMEGANPYWDDGWSEINSNVERNAPSLKPFRNIVRIFLTQEWSFSACNIAHHGLATGGSWFSFDLGN